MIQEILTRFQNTIGTCYKVEYITTDGNITYVFVYLLIQDKKFFLDMMFSILRGTNNKYYLRGSYQIDGRLNARYISAIENAINYYNDLL